MQPGVVVNRNRYIRENKVKSQLYLSSTSFTATTFRSNEELKPINNGQLIKINF